MVRRHASGETIRGYTRERVIEYVKAGPRGEEAHWAGGNYNSKGRLPLITHPTLILDATGFPLHSAQKLSKIDSQQQTDTIENGPMYCDRPCPKNMPGRFLTSLAREVEYETR